MEEQLVSVVVVTYNSESYILETLESILNQSYKNIELIITDDYSSDKTVEICEDWIKKNFGRFVSSEVLKAKSNNGIVSNITKGYKFSKGTYIKAIAGDDILLKNCIEELCEYANNNKNIDLLISNVQKFKSLEKKHIMKEIYPKKTDKYFYSLDSKRQLIELLWYIPPIPGALIRKDAIERIGYIDDEFMWVEDLITLVKILKINGKIGYIDKVTTLYREHENSISAKDSGFYNLKLKKEKDKIIKKYLNSEINNMNIFYKWSYKLNNAITKKVIENGNSITEYKKIRYLRILDPILIRNLFRRYI